MGKAQNQETQKTSHQEIAAAIILTQNQFIELGLKAKKKLKKV